MKKRARIGLTVALACFITVIVLVVTFAEELRIFSQLGTIPRLTIDRLYEEDAFGDGDIDTWVDFTLTNPGSKPLYYYGLEESPLLGREAREIGGEWELDGESGTGMSFHTLAPGESLSMTEILMGDPEERFFVGLSLSEEDEGVEIFSATIRAPAEE